MVGRKAFHCHHLRDVSVKLVTGISLRTVCPYSQVNLLLEAIGLESLCDTQDSLETVPC